MCTWLALGTAVVCRENCNSPAGSCEAGSCVCAPGFFGPTCADQRCPHDCWGHGSCAQGQSPASEGETESGIEANRHAADNRVCDAFFHFLEGSYQRIADSMQRLVPELATLLKNDV